MPAPPVQDDEPIPSTSGYNNIVNTNTTVDDDDEDFGTENRDYLHSEIQVELITRSYLTVGPGRILILPGWR